MSILNHPLFKALFNTSTPRIILKADAPNFTILLYNDAYMKVTYTHYRNIVGWYLWEAFDSRMAGSDENSFLIETLTRAVKNNETIVTAPFQYNIPSEDPNTIVESWWQLDIVPVEGNDTNPAYLLVTTNRINF